jgi:hypothetical protein
MKHNQILQRGPDDAYLASQGLNKNPMDSPQATLAKNAGLDVDGIYKRNVETAKAEFETNLRRTTDSLHKRADIMLVAACMYLSEEEARCVGDYPNVVALRDERLRLCPENDRSCRKGALSAWRAEHPNCARLDEWIDELMGGTSCMFRGVLYRPHSESPNQKREMRCY